MALPGATGWRTSSGATAGWRTASQRPDPLGRVRLPPNPDRLRIPDGPLAGWQSTPGAPGFDQRPAPQHHPDAPGLPATPGTPGGSSSSTPGPTTYPSPLDATYFQQLNNATLAANNRINASNLQSSYARTDLQNALSQLGYQQGQQTRQAQESENARGGFALGHLGDTLGQLNRSYLDRQGSAQQSFDRSEAGRSAARAAISQGLTLEQAALAAAAADRAATLAARNPAVGGPGGPSLTNPPSATPTTPAAAPGPRPDVRIPVPPAPDARGGGWRSVPGRGDRPRSRGDAHLTPVRRY